MNLLKSLLLGTIYPDWITSSFPIIRIVLMCLVILFSLAVIVVIMCMESNPEGGTNVISGKSESFYSQNKSATKEGRLKKIIIITSIALVVATLLFFISFIIYPASI